MENTLRFLAISACAAGLCQLLQGCGSNSGPESSFLPTPVPSMTAGPEPGYLVRGVVADSGMSGGNPRGIANATVSLFEPDTVLKEPILESKTSSAGEYALSVGAGRYVIEITPPTDAHAASGYDYPFYHTVININEPLNMPAIQLDILSEDEQQWIKQTNADRAQFGVRSTLKPDEFAMQAARTWANYLSQHPDATHFGPSPGETPQQRYSLLGGIGRDGENIDFALSDAPWQGAEIMWLSESQYCPTPVSISCPPLVDGHETGHFLNIINPDAVWMGVGENLKGAPFSGGGVWSAFDAEYVAYP